ncbi:DUF4189 domain-containing protein [Acuticoccus sp. M5D2P5]|uniref:DUF4189 domain-containing protein n=1 Tax=Acuticoccus kalidii TaxID=2910977 RepID=UPI001F1A5D39|nr:DUF4189 domain-containing protein [Acuticoccus kalidii]MCF3934660.1 DUF4189 domain-containing protein [Acuticoccus kalidii]
MMRAGLPITVIAAFALSMSAAAAQTGAGAAADEGDAGLPSLPKGCLAIAVDQANGGEGNGKGETLAEAEADAIALCKQSGGVNCTIETSSCNPDG